MKTINRLDILMNESIDQVVQTASVLINKQTSHKFIHVYACMPRIYNSQPIATLTMTRK